MLNQMKIMLVALAATLTTAIGAAAVIPTVASAATPSTPVVETTSNQGSLTTGTVPGTTTGVAVTTAGASNAPAGKTGVENQTSQGYARGGYHSGFHSFSSRRSSSGSTGGGLFGSSSRTTTSRGLGSTATLGRSGFGTHLFSFGTGMMLGSLFHPFGGYYGTGGYYGGHGFSLFGLIIDLIVLWIIWRIIRRIFFRR